MTTDELAAAVGTEAANALSSALAKIKHCLGQWTAEQVWWRSHPSLNSVGNLVLHLCGNVRQWIVAGLGGAADSRDRPAEFAERGPIPRTSCCAGWKRWWARPGQCWHDRRPANFWRHGASRALT